MQAIHGVYDRGNYTLEKNPPSDRSKIIVIFTEDATAEEPGMSTEEALEILAKFKGCIKSDFNYEKEKDEYFNEKYGSFD